MHDVMLIMRKLRFISFVSARHSNLTDVSGSALLPEEIGEMDGNSVYDNPLLLLVSKIFCFVTFNAAYPISNSMLILTIFIMHP